MLAYSAAFRTGSSVAAHLRRSSLAMSRTCGARKATAPGLPCQNIPRRSRPFTTEALASAHEGARATAPHAIDAAIDTLPLGLGLQELASHLDQRPETTSATSDDGNEPGSEDGVAAADLALFHSSRWIPKLSATSPFAGLTLADSEPLWERYQALTREERAALTTTDYNYLLVAQNRRRGYPPPPPVRQKAVFAELMERCEHDNPAVARTLGRFPKQWWDASGPAAAVADETGAIEPAEKVETSTSEAPDVVGPTETIADVKVAESEVSSPLMSEERPAARLRPTRVSFYRMIHALVAARQPGTAEYLLAVMSAWDLAPDQPIFRKLMTGYYRIRHGGLVKAIRLHTAMLECGLETDEWTYLVLVRACLAHGQLQKARSYYEEMVAKGYTPPTALLADLAIAYLKLDKTRTAQQFMAQMGMPKSWDEEQSACRVWTTIFHVSRPKLDAPRLETLFGQMLRVGVYPNRPLLSACALAPGRICALMDEHGVTIQARTFTTLLYEALKQQDFRQAMQVLACMKERSVPVGTYYYNALMDAFVRTGQTSTALQLYDEMLDRDVPPNAITFHVLLGGVAAEGNLDGAARLLTIMRDYDCQPDLVMYNTLIAHCGRLGRDRLATQLYKKLLADGLLPNAKTLEFLLSALSRHRPSSTSHGDGKGSTVGLSGAVAEEAWALYADHVTHQLAPTTTTYQLLIPLLCRGDHVERAWQVWDTMRSHEVVPTTGVCNYLMVVAEETRHTERVLEVWNVMLAAKIPRDPITFKAFLTCCHRARLLSMARSNLYMLLPSSPPSATVTSGQPSEAPSGWKVSASNLLQFATLLVAHADWDGVMELIRNWGRFGALLDMRSLKVLFGLCRTHPNQAAYLGQIAALVRERYPEALL
ncbi:hypothetical protein IWQ60_003104 [Tieghemiomyces parasiticus]|uniref:Pentacotripeptide-repeat region of PRORP domain-containing protein n=1 Tax=Tieghemiomyces parasiticus TaxID=78921 RepID=A0A9W8E0C9_9FUNG|nr:hypothetical protein IWQ60_003104 [Tieghemiomyces parasiticus]